MNETMLASECLIAASKAPIKSSLIAYSSDTNNSIFTKCAKRLVYSCTVIYVIVTSLARGMLLVYRPDLRGLIYRNILSGGDISDLFPVTMLLPCYQ